MKLLFPVKLGAHSGRLGGRKFIQFVAGISYWLVLKLQWSGGIVAKSTKDLELNARARSAWFQITIQAYLCVNIYIYIYVCIHIYIYIYMSIMS